MIVGDLHFVSITRTPLETYPILSIDTNAVLSCTLSGQFLQMVTGRNTQIVKPFCRIQDSQLAPGSPMQIGGETT
jgi:hypothetical protein